MIEVLLVRMPPFVPLISPLVAGDAKPAREVQTRLEVVAAIASICDDKDLKSASKAAISLGYLAAGDRSPALLEAVASALLGLSSKKGDELQFAVGEALCFAYGGVLPEIICLVSLSGHPNREP